MAEAIAKREARKRRILENSESRLQRITGRTNPKKLEDTSEKTSSEVNIQQTTEANLNGLILNETFGEKADSNSEHNTTHSGDSENEWSEPRSVFDLDDPRNGLSSTSHNFHKYKSTRNDDESDSSLANTDFNFEIHAHYDETYQDETAIVPNTLMSKPSLSYKLLSSRISYLLLAVVVNILLVLKLDHLFGQTITIPWLTMLLGRLCICRNFQESQDGSLLLAALILCNIKPDLIYKFKTIMTALTVTFSDLAFYIFSFTLFHSGFSYYLYNLEMM